MVIYYHKLGTNTICNIEQILSTNIIDLLSIFYKAQIKIDIKHKTIYNKIK